MGGGVWVGGAARVAGGGAEPPALGAGGGALGRGATSAPCPGRLPNIAYSQAFLRFRKSNESLPDGFCSTRGSRPVSLCANWRKAWAARDWALSSPTI